MGQGKKKHLDYTSNFSVSLSLLQNEQTKEK